MAQTGRQIIVLDNFQNVDKRRDRLLVAQTLELLSDRAGETGDVKLVVIGIADDASDLLSTSGSVNRRVVEIGVPRMPDEEIRQVLRKGFSLLGLEIGDQLIERLVFFVDGFPYFAHLLGLEIARAARKVQQYTISSALVKNGLETAAAEVAQSYRQRVRLAMEIGGEVQPRRRILEMLAYSGQREWSVRDVTILFEQRVGPRDDYAFLAAALAALTQPKHGDILKRTGSAGKYSYKFRDPHLRPYLRIAVFPADEASSG